MDRNALRIWFATWPLLVKEVVAGESNGSKRLLFFQMNGQFRLQNLADQSHQFFYGHRYWPAIKKAIDTSGAGDLYSRVEATANKSGVPVDFAMAMSAVAYMTLEQCGSDFLSSSYEPSVVKEKPEDWLRRRATPMRPSLMERLKGKSSCERVIFDEKDPQGFFAIQTTQDITTAAELDKRPFHETDKRCYEGMGPIPVDCRSGSCGTCWVGILGGNENLDPVEDFERKRIEYFGYWDSGFVVSPGERPLIRLSCQTKANGSVSVVIPPWNGVFGRSRREKESAD